MSNRTIRIDSVKNNICIADECEVADSFFSRLRGLIGRSELEIGTGLMLKPCNDIHMWFMSIPIDVVFIQVKDCSGVRAKVTSVHKNLPPWRFLPLRDRRASITLELPVGTIERCELRPGDELCLS